MIASVFPSFGPLEALVIFGVILLIFGPQKLPEVAEALGKSIRKFKTATKEARDELTEDLPRREDVLGSSDTSASGTRSSTSRSE